MEEYTDDHSAILLTKPWLTKIDNTTSTPYLIKFCTSDPTSANCCCVLVTDTKRTWAEVLTRKGVARRWRDCNRPNMGDLPDIEEEVWRTNILDLLNNAHTLGGITDLSFEVVESNYADFAFELEFETFKWRWETSFLGYKTSTNILSEHLIVPLISVNHLAFSSADPVSELSATDLENAIDKAGRTAKRRMDIHFKNSMSKPRVATVLQRVTSILYSTSDLPPIIISPEKPELHPPAIRRPPRDLDSYSMPAGSTSQQPVTEPIKVPHSSSKAPLKLQGEADSATESEEDIRTIPTMDSEGKAKIMHLSRSPSAGRWAQTPGLQSTHPSRIASPMPNEMKQNQEAFSDSDSSPLRPVKKKQKQILSSDDDNEAARQAQVRGGAPAKRGTRQPIKRGGKRF